MGKYGSKLKLRRESASCVCSMFRWERKGQSEIGSVTVDFALGVTRVNTMRLQPTISIDQEVTVITPILL